HHYRGVEPTRRHDLPGAHYLSFPPHARHGYGRYSGYRALPGFSRRSIECLSERYSGYAARRPWRHDGAAAALHDRGWYSRDGVDRQGQTQRNPRTHKSWRRRIGKVDGNIGVVRTWLSRSTDGGSHRTRSTTRRPRLREA